MLPDTSDHEHGIVWARIVNEPYTERVSGSPSRSHAADAERGYEPMEECEENAVVSFPALWTVDCWWILMRDAATRPYRTVTWIPQYFGTALEPRSGSASAGIRLFAHPVARTRND